MTTGADFMLFGKQLSILVTYKFKPHDFLQKEACDIVLFLIILKIHVTWQYVLAVMHRLF